MGWEPTAAAEAFAGQTVEAVEAAILERYDFVSVAFLPNARSTRMLPGWALELLRKKPDTVRDEDGRRPELEGARGVDVLNLPDLFPQWIALAADTGGGMSVGVGPTLAAALFAITVGGDLSEASDAKKEGGVH